MPVPKELYANQAFGGRIHNSASNKNFPRPWKKFFVKALWPLSHCNREKTGTSKLGDVISSHRQRFLLAHECTELLIWRCFHWTWLWCLVFAFFVFLYSFVLVLVLFFCLLYSGNLSVTNDWYNSYLYCGSRWWLLLSNCLNWKIYCDDHTSLSSTTAVQIWIISYIVHMIPLHGKIWTQ